MKVASGTRIPDAPSGFPRGPCIAMAAIQLNVFNNYTYTLETIIQAGRKGIPITSVPGAGERLFAPTRGSSPRSEIYLALGDHDRPHFPAIYKPSALFRPAQRAIAAIPARVRDRALPDLLHAG